MKNEPVVQRSIVRFPKDCAPARAPVHTFNEIETSASPAAVWARLIDAVRWPEFYKNSKNVVIDGADELGLGTSFRWTTFGLRVRTVVEEFEEGSRLAWRGGAAGAVGYHGWVIEPKETGCRIVTEETQRGVGPWLGRWYLRRALVRHHQAWLEGLAAGAREK